MQLELDTPVDPDYPIYTRANAGEVLPGVASPLGWSLIGGPMEHGFRASLCGDCGAFRWPDDDRFLFVGRFAGRFHLNLAVLREAAQHLPGTSADAIDEQYFGDPEGLGLPAYEPQRGEGLWVLRSGPATLRTMAALGRRIRRERLETEALVRDNRAFAASSPSDEAVVARLRDLQPHFTNRFGTHITARALTSSAVELLGRAAQGVGADGDLHLRLLTGLPELESSQPSLALRRIADEIGAESPLGKSVLDGLSWDELEASGLAGADVLRRRLGGFLLRFGHRGLNEFEPTWPAWEQEPDVVLGHLASVMRAEEGGDRRHEHVRAGAVAEVAALGWRAPVLRRLAANAQQAVVRGETTKATAIRVTHEMRRLIWLLRGRWEERVSGDLALLTLDELAHVAAGGDVPDDVLARRAEELRRANEVEVPEVLIGEVRTVSRDRAAATGATELHGIGGSAGRAVGTVRVVEDPLDRFDDGDVLVASVTDTAWTPLFLAASAVVTDIGGVLSHATIVARDLGIPAVVNTKVATRELRTGTVVEVDGSAGVVRVLEERS